MNRMGGERLGQVVPTGELGELLPHIDLQVLDQRPAQRVSNLKTLVKAKQNHGF